MDKERKRNCVNCGNNIRTPREDNPCRIECHCKLDGHYIGYVKCFEGWCKHWCKDKLQVMKPNIQMKK